MLYEADGYEKLGMGQIPLFLVVYCDIAVEPQFTKIINARELLYQTETLLHCILIFRMQ